MAPGIHEPEVGPKNCAKHSRIIAHDRQSAAPFRSIQSEGAYDNVSTGPDRLLQVTDIGGATGSIGEEMKRRTVMPQIVGLGWLLGGDIRNHPFDAGGSLVAKALLKTLSGRIERGGGKIQDRDPSNFTLDKRVHES